MFVLPRKFFVVGKYLISNHFTLWASHFHQNVTELGTVWATSCYSCIGINAVMNKHHAQPTYYLTLLLWHQWLKGLQDCLWSFQVKHARVDSSPSYAANYQCHGLHDLNIKNVRGCRDGMPKSMQARYRDDILVKVNIQSLIPALFSHQFATAM